MNRLSRTQRWCLATLLMGAVLFVVLFVPYIAFRGISSMRKARPNSLTPLVGTWRGEHSNIIDLRSDGTARSRSDDPDREVSYFEWTMSPTELAILQGPDRGSVRWVLARYYGPTGRFEILEIAPDQFQILDLESGQRLLFTRTTDEILESVP